MDKNRKNKAKLEAEGVAPEKPIDPNAEKIKKQFDQISRYQAKRENLLLGEFSADGKYSLADDTLMQDLVSMPKVLQERVDNVAYAYTKYNGFNLNFKIELDISESYCSAEMFLIEIEHKPDEDVKHLTSLGNFVEMYSPSFKDNVYKTWNINLQETPLDKDDVVFKMLKELDGENNFSKELIEILSQLYIVRLLKLLDNCGTLGLKIQGEYRALVEELIRKDPSLAQDHTRLKQILDKVIAKHNGFATILSMPAGMEILKGFADPIGRVTGGAGPVLVEGGEKKEEKPAEKTEAKAEAPKKKKAKSKGGGDGAKPYVWAIKNYKPAILTVPTEAEKILASKDQTSQEPRVDASEKPPKVNFEPAERVEPPNDESQDEEVESQEEEFISEKMRILLDQMEGFAVNDAMRVHTEAQQNLEAEEIVERLAGTQENMAVEERTEHILGGGGN